MFLIKVCRGKYRECDSLESALKQGSVGQEVYQVDLKPLGRIALVSKPQRALEAIPETSNGMAPKLANCESEEEEEAETY